ncbi:Hypothetical_protein [Hexamita inflata]|uniref:Hypothetical_protein n=1 Tax=Hexamita inflata TaxID=28002 RepID=A0AA86UG28_9EUKA|nr:Hypothetical protein HINF_LOCUS38161 [Hexamita inflata]CAI9950520.1 Hypothetical protein HINF_LOCUS38165 [Hexamita inflata]
MSRKLPEKSRCQFSMFVRGGIYGWLRRVGTDPRRIPADLEQFKISVQDRVFKTMLEFLFKIHFCIPVQLRVITRNGTKDFLRSAKIDQYCVYKQVQIEKAVYSWFHVRQDCKGHSKIGQINRFKIASEDKWQA